MKPEDVKKAMIGRKIVGVDTYNFAVDPSADPIIESITLDNGTIIELWGQSDTAMVSECSDIKEKK